MRVGNAFKTLKVVQNGNLKDFADCIAFVAKHLNNITQEQSIISYFIGNEYDLQERKSTTLLQSQVQSHYFK